MIGGQAPEECLLVVMGMIGFSAVANIMVRMKSFFAGENRATGMLVFQSWYLCEANVSYVFRVMVKSLFMRVNLKLKKPTQMV